MFVAATSGHDVEVHRAAVDVAAGNVPFARKGEWFAAGRQQALRLVRQIEDKPCAVEKRDGPVDAREERKRTICADMGDADAPVESINSAAFRKGQDLLGEAP